VTTAETLTLVGLVCTSVLGAAALAHTIIKTILDYKSRVAPYHHTFYHKQAEAYVEIHNALVNATPKLFSGMYDKDNPPLCWTLSKVKAAVDAVNTEIRSLSMKWAIYLSDEAFVALEKYQTILASFVNSLPQTVSAHEESVKLAARLMALAVPLMEFIQIARKRMGIQRLSEGVLKMLGSSNQPLKPIPSGEALVNAAIVALKL
jgi:hypothetical protein